MTRTAADQLGDALVEPAVALVRTWLAAAERALTSKERRERRRFQLLTGDERSLAFTMAFCDRVLRPEDPAVAARQLVALGSGSPPAFLSGADRLLLKAGVQVAERLPGVVMPLTRRRLRQVVGGLIVDRDDPSLARHLRGLRAAGFAVNVNLLGEDVLGEQEAARRVAGISDLIRRSDVDYVSVKASAVASQLNLWGYDETLRRVCDALRVLFRAAAGSPGGPTFLNLDMEEYRDLRLTVDAFTRLLAEPDLRELDAGIVLQAYLPDSFDVLREIVEWAGDRVARGGGTVKVRIVKGANLAMEAVEAITHGWAPAPYASKAETDANYKRMLDWAMEPDRLSAVRLGVGTHNLFDLAWAHLLSEARNVAGRVQFEMLQGMAPGIERVVQRDVGSVRLYTPVVAPADFDSALAYLFRRLEENSSGDNFLRSMFEIAEQAGTFDVERDRFAKAVSARWTVSTRPRRQLGVPEAPGFRNAADADPTDERTRAAVTAALAGYQPAHLPDSIMQTARIDEAFRVARAAAAQWAGTAPAVRRDLLGAVAGRLTARRPHLLAVMAHEARKTLTEGDPEVSEVIDMAAYYAQQIPGARAGFEHEATFDPLGVVVVAPPWNFPLAIPGGGVFAALAAGNAVILKAPPQTPQCAYVIAECVWEALRTAGLPTDVLQYLRCPEEVVGEHLISHRGCDGVILTGARETAQLFARLAPDTPLFAETSGKNALVVMPDADLDLAAADLIRSAFGHAGQKCSAASLAILVGSVYDSARFRRQLVDAARSLALGPATDPAAVMPALIGRPSAALERALTRLDPGESWLLEPVLRDAGRQVWSPGIKLGVRAGSWFHRTECFGPVLGLVAAGDLDEALAIQNATEYGLTGGIHTLDPAAADYWLERVQVGNAYVNRVTTGAVVQRQPFGGWKGSVVGPGAKAGGPNYVAQLGRWSDAAPPTRAERPAPEVLAWLAEARGELDPNDRQWLDAAVSSDAWWARHHFTVEHDPAGLFCEANVFRYRPLRSVVVRVEADALPGHVIRTIAAARVAGSTVVVSAAAQADHPGIRWLVDRVETAAELAARVAVYPPERIRVVGTRLAPLPRSFGDCHVDDRPVVADGGVEGLRYRREQSVSQTLHRFGNLIRAF